MALADAFLADLDEDEAEDLDRFDDDFGDPSSSSSSSSSASSSSASVLDAFIGDEVHQIATLSRSERYISVMEGIDESKEETPTKERVGVLEDDPEYKLIVAANEVAADITNEIIRVHRFVRNIYNKKFPDLDTLVPTPIEYIQTVQKIGNEKDLTLVDLSSILPPAQIMVVVTASTTGGELLSEDDLRRVDEGCDEANKLQEGRNKILRFVESRMSFIAPNLSRLVGSSVAARLMAEAGGLTALSLLPACNIQNIGARRKTLAGFSSKKLQHAGYIYEAALIEGAPPSLKTKAIRMVTTRCILAARVDSFRDCPSGDTGQQFFDEIQKKLEKFNEPPPAKKEKALPVPDEVRKKRRAGRRYRKQKEMLQMSELRKQANRVKFGEEAQTEYMGHDFGMIGTGGGGTGSKLRVAISEQAPKLSKKRQRQLDKESGFKTSGFKTARYGGTVSTVSGFTSSFAMTPVQGLDLGNPDALAAAQEKAREANDKYFSDMSGFLKVGKRAEEMKE